MFNLGEDIGETNDLSKSMPEKTKTLQDKLKRYIRDVDAEDIRDMRAARRAELLEYKARAKKNINKIRKAIRDASRQDKKALQEKLRQEQKRMKAHQSGLDQLERGRRVISW